MPWAVLSWSACPPELLLTLQSSRPCYGVIILAIASVLAAAAAAVLYRYVVHGDIQWCSALGVLRRNIVWCLGIECDA